jgi:NAD dependent epimerase/dehydratase
MKLSEEKVLVTGAGGFIGSHLTELLVRYGVEVRAVVHYNSRNDLGNLELLPPDVRDALDVRPIDIADPFSVNEVVKGSTVVFHLAALIGIPYSYLAPASYVDTNIRGMLNVLEAGRRCGVQRLVHTSTSEVYGTAQYTPIDEEHPLQAQSPYSASKIAADKLAESYYRSFEVPVSIIRPFNTYGPRQSARAVIPTIITQVLGGTGPIRLGNLSPVRDFTYVTDTARAFVQIAESEQSVGMVCNVGTGKGISIHNLAQKVVDLMNADVEIICEEERMRPEESEVFELICCADRIQKLTGWKPEVSLDDGLMRVIAYIQENINAYKVNTYVV